ncbi:MAG TPA: UPF0182 family protein [Actinomycetota bacterium]|nr:UPF0182 family protein [Actinomycetota bacterium]
MATTVRIPYARRRWPVVAIVVVVAAFILLSFLSNFYVDILWYREVGLSQVFWTKIWAQAGLASAFFVTFFALLLVNLYVTRRLAPRVVALTPEQEIVERFRENIEPYLRWAIPLGAAILSLFVGLAASGHWQEFLLWRSSGGITFGNPEQVFNRDPAFYVFTLPWLKYLQGWLFGALVGVTVIVGIGHFLQGGIRPQAVGLSDKVDPQVRAHLSVLLGLVLLAKAWGYYLGRFDLLSSERGVVQGASYTDVNAQLPALTFLAIVAVICAVLFFVNARYRVWSLPIIAVGLLLLVSILLGTAYPAFIQQFRVAPNEQQRELPYIERNIAGTRRAFGLEEIRLEERPFESRVSAEAVEANEATIANIRLWRPSVLKENFESVQRIRQYYDFADVDVDRYEIDGERRVLMVSGREVTQEGISETAKTWQNQHLVYTHGFGAVAAQVNATTSDGAPLLTLEDIPPEGQPVTTQPRIYYGEVDEVDFVVVNSLTEELDYEGASGETPFVYDGRGGIELGGFFRRALFAWRLQDANLLISGQIDADSRIIINRSIQARAADPLPFLTFDADPYLAVTPEGYVWIWDAYTTSDGYPYSQGVDLAEVTAGLLPEQEVNYMRNSVKAVVDAYDGSVTYYADLDEPMMQAWAAAFPGVFTPIGDAPDELRAHFRYPENLFQAQAFQFANYHVQEPAAFYRKQDFWEIPPDPTLQGTVTGPGGSPAPAPVSSSSKLLPSYQLMKIPGEPVERFHLVIPFQPENRLNMVGWMASNSDPEGYGELVAFTLPSGRDVDGPGLVFSRVNSDEEFSEVRTLLDSGGSKVIFGDLLTIPIEDSILYVLPVYVRAAGASAVPELELVLVVNGSTVTLAGSLPEAIADATGAVTGEEPPPPPDGGEGTVQQQVERLLSQAVTHFTAAQEALRNGDLAGYQSELEQAQALVEQANELLSGDTGDPSPSPTP